MSEDQVFPVPADVAKAALINSDQYNEMYQRSIEDPEGFWAEHGKRIDWIKPYTKIKNIDFSAPVHIKWYYDGTLNAAANCLDRHLATRGDQAAIIWEGDGGLRNHRHVNGNAIAFFNALGFHGV